MNTRRSRQCSGSRARNYRRALARVNAGRYSEGAAEALLAQATKTGALASHRRHQKTKVDEYYDKRAEDMNA